MKFMTVITSQHYTADLNFMQLIINKVVTTECMSPVVLNYELIEVYDTT